MTLVRYPWSIFCSLVTSQILVCEILKVLNGSNAKLKTEI